MDSLKERFEKKYLQPQGRISRYFSTLFIFLAGAGSIYIYFAIKYFLCVSDGCADLVITKPWVNMPTYFVVYGVCCIIISVFVWRSRQIQTLFVGAMDVLVGSGFLIIGKIFFAIAIELGRNT